MIIDECRKTLILTEPVSQSSPGQREQDNGQKRYNGLSANGLSSVEVVHRHFSASVLKSKKTSYTTIVDTFEALVDSYLHLSTLGTTLNGGFWAFMR
jgi:hypothetical protein